MKVSLILIAALIFLASASIPQNLAVDRCATEKIRAFDLDFIRSFDVYSAGVRETPHALLFDKRGDKYHLPCRFWEEPLSEGEILYAIRRLEDQYQERIWGFSFPPRALQIVNTRGEVVGYIYTGLDCILMKREKDGRVTVFLPDVTPSDGDGEEWELPQVSGP